MHPYSTDQRPRLAAAAVAAWIALFFAGRATAGEVVSGLTAGENPTAFNVRDCTGPAAGKTLCYFCRYGSRPVAAIYTRSLTDEVADLIAATDQAVARNREGRLAAVVVYLGPDTAEAEQQLKQLAKDKHLQHTPLTILQESAEQLHEKYRIADNAAVTVLMWRDYSVCDNAAWDTARLTAAETTDVVRRIEAIAQ